MRVVDRTCDHTNWSSMGQVPDRDMYCCIVCHAYFTGQELEVMNSKGLNSDNRVGLVYDLHELNHGTTEDWLNDMLKQLEGTVLYKNAYPYSQGGTPANEVEVGTSERRFLVSETGGRKEIKEQRHALIPPKALSALSEIYGRGAAKYEDNNWRKGYNWSASYDALQRHLSAFWAGENYDPESGQAHLMHAAWHCFTLYTFSTESRYLEFDDRWEGD